MGIFNLVFGKKIQEKADNLAAIKTGEEIQKIKAQLGYGYGQASYIYSTGKSGGAKWDYGLNNSGAGRFLDHRTIRRNARAAYHDTPQAKTIVDRFADTVADIGLKLECTPVADILGISPEEAETWSKNVEARFHLWAMDKKQHRSEQLSFYQTHRLYSLWQQRDNDIFTRLYYSADSNLLNPLQFEFIDPDMIRADAYTTTYGAICSEDGIERDDRGREKAYKVWVFDHTIKDGPQYKEVTIKRKGPKSGRLFMLHGFQKEYAGQGRGFSRLAGAIQELENLTDFSGAQIKKAINQSNLVFMMENDQADPSAPFDDILTNHGAGPAAEQFGAVPEPSEDAEGVTDESLTPIKYIPIPEATTNAPGSTAIFNATQGDKLKAVENTAPSDSFDKFVDAFFSYLSASTGMPLEVALMKFNQNYSASRATLILFWRIAIMWRQEMAADYLDPIKEMWMTGEIAAGRIQAPGWSDPVLRAAWLNCNWIGTPMPNIDPMRTAKADQVYVELGAQTLDRVARNLNGSSGESNRAKLTREYKELPAAPWQQKQNGGN